MTHAVICWDTPSVGTGVWGKYNIPTVLKINLQSLQVELGWGSRKYLSPTLT